MMKSSLILLSLLLVLLLLIELFLLDFVFKNTNVPCMYVCIGIQQLSCILQLFICSIMIVFFSHV